MALNSVQAQDGISFPIPVLHTHPQHKQNPKYKLAPNVNSITFEKTVVETHGLGTGSTTGSPVCFGGGSHASAPPSAAPRTPPTTLSIRVTLRRISLLSFPGFVDGVNVKGEEEGKGRGIKHFSQLVLTLSPVTLRAITRYFILQIELLPFPVEITFQ